MSSTLDELFAYVGFKDADAQRLRELHPMLEPHFPEVARRFYDAVGATPSAAAILDGPAQVDRLRGSLIDWMSTGLLGPHDQAFYEKRARIGRRHVAIGLQNNYMFTAMSVVRTAYHDLISSLFRADQALMVTRTVNKLLDVELAIMVGHYQLDTAAKIEGRERQVQAERIASMQTLTAGLATEVRDPLDAAKLQLELLERRLRRGAHEPRLVEPSELAQKEIQRVTDLLNKFLAFASPPELHLQTHDVSSIVRELAEVERVSAEGLGTQLALIACPQKLLARVDGPKLRQILVNLVRNAIEAVSLGGHVTLDLFADEHRLRFRVQDDGAGMPDKVLSRVYEPFFSTKEGRAGLGMSIVYSLVTLHGGEIEIATGPTGTRLEVSIPRHAA